ncbi:MAG: NADH-quinone oxidoreductase subunit M [Acidobacteria bacterium]|nr:NADH-quinone oxidoreductase subunit M [Acidobacteriota bacterium]
MPLLTLSWLLPLAGAIGLLLVGNADGRRNGAIRWLTLAVSLATLAVTAAVWAGFDPAVAEFQFVERVPWIPAFGIDYSLGVDGISLLLVVLTAFLTPIALLSSWGSIERKVKEFSIFMLALEAAMIGVFVALDLFLFYVFWDAMLVPMYFLIGIWGYDRRIYAAIKFMLYTMAGSVLMLVAILGLAYLHSAATGRYSFDLLALSTLDIAPQTEMWFFLAFTVAFAIKVPLFPFHTWLPDAHVEAPTAGSVILAGVLLKMGTYGLLRFSFPLFPEAAASFAPWLALLAVVGIIYGALVAMVQPDMKKLVAYSSVSHLGFVVLGICAMNAQGVQGAIYLMLAHGVSTGGLFLMVGMLSDRRHTRLIGEYGGLKAVVPRLSAAFLIITLASIGLPMLNGFPGEFLIMLGAFRWDPRFVVAAGLGVILSAVYMLWMVQRVYYGEVRHGENATLPDLHPREWASVLPICAMAVVMGVFPTLFLRPMEASVEALVQQMQATQTLRAMDNPHPPAPRTPTPGNWTAMRPVTRILYSLSRPHSGPSRAERGQKRWLPAKGSGGYQGAVPLGWLIGIGN